jgi:hypothetical protein
MNENSVVSLRQKDEIDDPLTEILRTGARRLITRAVARSAPTAATRHQVFWHNFRNTQPGSEAAIQTETLPEPSLA